MTGYRFTPATSTDYEAVLGIYRSLVGTSGCTWDEEYPGPETIEKDLRCGALHCLRDMNGKPVAVASMGRFGELDDLPWPERLHTPCELARIGVMPTFQGHGLGTQLLQACLCLAKRCGFDGIRLLVSVGNPAALALYAKNGFICYGQTHRYGSDYFFEQKVFPIFHDKKHRHPST